MKNKYFTAIFVSVLFLASCGGNSVQEEAINETDEITISKEQFKTSGMELGLPIEKEFNHSIQSSGYIRVKPSGIARIHIPVEGILRYYNLQEGTYVYKGQLLFSIESNEILKLQQQFAETSALIKSSEAEYLRLKKLSQNQISSQKDFQEAESKYLNILATYRGLRTQLEQLHIAPEKVEQGTFTKAYYIYAPLSGYISRLDAINGQYAKTDDFLLELIDVQQLQLEINIFEKDIAYIEKDMDVEFYLPGQNDIIFHGNLSSIGKSINPDTKSVRCYADINKNSTSDKFINGMYVETILKSDKKSGLSIPEQAVVSSAGQNFIYIKTGEDETNYYFKELEVKTGMKSDAHIEILNNINDSLLIKGAFSMHQN
ncbi:MAG: efflux RND transporter periplasmic adaptor subunit [Bacteroidales bacterium]|nr:efflux RND transporter periplasmic adaptor subunit [Bacteroidales bacterium]